MRPAGPSNRYARILFREGLVFVSEPASHLSTEIWARFVGISVCNMLIAKFLQACDAAKRTLKTSAKNSSNV